MAKQTETTVKTYILELHSGNIRKVDVPSNWSLTFGPTVPYSGKGMSVAQGGTALRFYEGTGKTKLRAIFTDVRSFRDASIPIMEKRTETKRKVLQKSDKRGAGNVIVEARVTEWVNPDDDKADSDAPSAPNPFLLATQSVDDPFADDILTDK